MSMFHATERVAGEGEREKEREEAPVRALALALRTANLPED